MDVPAVKVAPDYSALPLSELDISDPRMFQFDYWHGLFARLREE